jgi:hypothetical protein
MIGTAVSATSPPPPIFGVMWWLYGGTMSRKAIYGDRTKKTVRLPAELDQRLDEFARERCVAQNLVIERAVEDFLDRQRPREPQQQPWDWKAG